MICLVQKSAWRGTNDQRLRPGKGSSGLGSVTALEEWNVNTTSMVLMGKVPVPGRESLLYVGLG